MTKIPTVLLVEDNNLLRVGLRVSLERLNKYQIAGEAEDGRTAIKMATKLQPDLILMDVGLPLVDGIEATWKIKQNFPRIRVIMFTSHTNPEDVTAALGAGADGYCTKDTPIHQIDAAIKAVMLGEVWLDPALAEFVSGNLVSDIESKIVALIQAGKNNVEIATELNATNEKIARIMNKIINRFVDKSTVPNLNVEDDFPDSKKWLEINKEQLNGKHLFNEKYVLHELIGSGGLGTVYKAKHLYMDRYVALKFLRPEYSEDRRVIRNFQLEAMAIANLQHKNIIGIYDFGIGPKYEPFLVMEFSDSTSLFDILQQEKRLPVRRLTSLLLQICEGLMEAHRKGIIHCDLKPSNILVQNTNPETVKLVDFGLAQILSRDAPLSSGQSETFTTSGTPLYMSPEQCAAKALDARSDIYSLGCVLHEALTGENVFKGRNTLETIMKQCQMEAPAMSSVYPEGGFSSAIEFCVAKMLMKDPDDRLQTIEEVIDLLHVLPELKSPELPRD